MIREKRWIFDPTPLAIPWALFLSSQIFSTVFSIHPWTSWLGYYSRFNGGLASTLAYALLYFGITSNLEKKDVPIILHSILIGGVFAALYAFPEHFGHSPSCWLITNSFDVNCWVQDVQTRVFGTFGQPNWLAAYLIGVLPFSIGLSLFFWERKKWTSVLYILASTLLFTVLLFTKSRSGILGLGIGLIFSLVNTALFFTFLHRRKKLAELKKTNWKSVLIPLTITGFIWISLFFTIGSSFRETILQTIGMYASNSSSSRSEPAIEKPATGTQLESGGTESGVIRSIVWKGALAVWNRYPIFGSGVETFAYSYYQDRPIEHNMVSEWDFLYNKAHNEVLNYLATTGVVGLSSYLLLIVFIFYWSIRKIVQAFREKEISLRSFFLAITMLSGLLAIHVSNFLGFSTVAVSSLSMSAFPAILVLLFSSSNKGSSTIRSTQVNAFAIEQWFAIGGILLVTFIGLRSVYDYWKADTLFTLAKRSSQRVSNLNDIDRTMQLFSASIQRSPNEALFRDEFAYFSSQIAVLLAQENEATLSAQIAQISIQSLMEAKALNNRNLNFYKSRAKTYIVLSQLEKAFLKDAYLALDEAGKIAPTDPKIPYNLGVLAQESENLELAKTWYERTLQLKPDYQEATSRLQKISSQK